MKCQKCQQAEATTHITQTINGYTTQKHLCSKCAQEENAFEKGFFADFHSEFENMPGSFFSTALPSRTGASHCKTCSSTYAEISQSGRVGCADCYKEFINELMPSVRRIHGNTVHCGKKPRSGRAAAQPEVPDDERARLQQELDEAVKVQDFEKAASLRDKIKELDAGKK